LVSDVCSTNCSQSYSQTPLNGILIEALFVREMAMELEMFLNGKFIDSMTIKESALERIHDFQHKMEKKHCHHLEYSDGQPQFFISGLSEQDVKVTLAD